jgi:predicted Fe-Mo cluster-binding NifX family protein
VASKTGVLVDEHFGHAESFYIYEWKDGAVFPVERREIDEKYCGQSQGCGEPTGVGHGSKFATVFDAVSDCAGVIVMRIGEEPRTRLAERGIKVIMTYDYVEEAVRGAYSKLGEN